MNSPNNSTKSSDHIKKVYQKPKLQTYGDVATITQSIGNFQQAKMDSGSAPGPVKTA
jgi:hypothetical protein